MSGQTGLAAQLHLVFVPLPIAEVLHRPHQLQRQFLAVGQALDAGDVEAFVGAVAAQGGDGVAGLYLPDLDRAVVAATGEEAAVRAGPRRLGWRC